MIKYLIRALRLPFVSASILPFVLGSLIIRQHFNLAGFLLGLSAVVSVHLASNLINDYSDSKSGADWQDNKFYGFFGGSKLIQENILSEGFYLKGAIIFYLAACVSVILLYLQLKNWLVIAMPAAVLILSWQYSHKPLRFSYHRLGEPVIFLLFGPALVMGGYFIQTGIFPDQRSFFLSIPCGMLTTAILFINQIPDYPCDIKARKFNWVSLTGHRDACHLYYFLVFTAYISIIYCVAKGYAGMISLFSLIFIFYAVKSGRIATNSYLDKKQFVAASQATIALQAMVVILLILGVL